MGTRCLGRRPVAALLKYTRNSAQPPQYIQAIGDSRISSAGGISLVAAMEGAIVEGFLQKNHAGQDFAKINYKRFFVAEGFTVFYYSDATKKTVRGHFDLRNVVGICQKDVSGAGTGAIELRIAEPSNRQTGGSSPPKRMVLSFSPEPPRRAEWLRLFCSAILGDYVDGSVAGFIDPALADALNAEYGDVEAVSANKSFFSRRAPTTRILTPRSSITPRGGSAPSMPKLESFDTMPNLNLDTPRGSPRK